MKKSNLDGGTSVGFSSDFILSGHGNLPQAAATNTVIPIDFHIEENLEQINIQQWEDIENKLAELTGYNSSNFLTWLKENYFATEKKIT